MFVRELIARHAAPGESWLGEVASVRALQQAGALLLDAPLTILTGENGVGKSTLLECIAAAYGFPRNGGPVDRGYRHPLLDYATLAAGQRRKAGYFLRAETHYALGKKFDTDGPGGQHMHRMSHGESVIDVLSTFPADGLYLLDEPESGLSPVGQMAAVGLLGRLLLDSGGAGSGSAGSAVAGAQIIMVTHSPIMLALATGVPGARIIEITADGNFEYGLQLEDTVAFRAMEDFLAEAAAVARYMCVVTDD